MTMHKPRHQNASNQKGLRQILLGCHDGDIHGQVYAGTRDLSSSSVKHCLSVETTLQNWNTNTHDEETERSELMRSQ